MTRRQKKQLALSVLILLRLPFVLAGILSVLLKYRVGFHLIDQRAGMLAAVLMTFMFYPNYYSQIARPYIFVLLFTLCIILAFIKMTKKPGLPAAFLLALAMLGL